MVAIPDWAGDVPHETVALLGRYVDLLKHWNGTINLIGKATQHDIWGRHIWDSYQLLPLVPKRAKTLVDLGSGAGLPGLVLAIAAPKLAVTLVERDIRKSTFLREAARSLGLSNVTVRNDDAHFLDATFDVITARALASINDLCELALPLMGTASICLFPKGENFANEVAHATEFWSFEEQVIHSETHEKAGIVSISKLNKRAG
jgi:16S rRNA (guanine527-N7)-methyltransferase